ncbi:MAG TPA: flippase [Bacteroidota bacterium]|nr:flippase [Bacteroidota bacterium]
MKRLSRNFFSLVFSDIGRRILGFFAIAYLARKVGPADFGMINIGFTVLSYGLMISSGGLSMYGTRMIAKEISVDLVDNILGLRFLSTIITFGIITIIAVLFIPSKLMAVLIILFSLSLFANAILLDWYFQGKEEMGIVGIGKFVSAAVYCFVVVAFVQSSDDVLWVAVAAFAGDLICSSIIFIVYKRRERARIQLKFSMWNDLIRKSLPIGSGTILGHLSVNFPPLALGIIMTNTEVGYYSAASKLVFFLLMFDRVLATILLPVSTRYHTYSPEKLSTMLHQALKWIVIIALPICVGGSILADRLLPLVFGMQYGDSIEVFQILVWYFFATMVHTIYTSGLLAIGQEKLYGRTMFFSILIYSISIVSFTMFVGVIGAAYAMVLSEIITLILMRNQFRRFVVVHLPEHLFKIVIAAILMGCALVIVPSINVLLGIVMGAVVYTAILFATRTITSDNVSEMLGRF